MNYCYYIFTPKGVNYFLQYLLLIFFRGQALDAQNSLQMLWLAAYLTGVPPVGLHALRWTHSLTPMILNLAKYPHLSPQRAE